MSFWSALVAIVAIIAFAELRKAKYHSEVGIIRDNSGNQQIARSPRENELQREVEELRARLEVLERIATDDRQARQIAAEIESLRDS